jgi:uncharacterized protein YkwD
MQPRPTRARRRPTARLALEQLEDRQLLTASPTGAGQVFLERLNDARANPAAYGQSIGVNLSNVAPAPPLAFDPALIQAAHGHAVDMNARNYVGHGTLAPNITNNHGNEVPDPTSAMVRQRLTAAGFSPAYYAESWAAGSAYARPEDALRALIVDSFDPGLGHRKMLLGMNDPQSGRDFRLENQVGVGVVQGGTGAWTNYYTVDSANAAASPAQPFLTGVVYRDADGNGRYDSGEGLGGVTLTVFSGSRVVATTTTFDSGGYRLPLSAGSYTVTAGGGGLAAPVTRTVTMGTVNSRLDFVAQPAAPAVPTVTGPASPTTSPTPTITWTASAGATRYELWVSDLTRGVNPFVHLTNLTATSYTPSSGWAAGTYRVWVQAFNAAGVGSGASATRDFTITAAAAGLADRVVQFAHDRLGQTVGGGECTDLVINALQAAGARTTYDYGVSGPNADYVWGSLVLTHRAGDSAAGFAAVQAGDVIQFRDVVSRVSSGGSNSSWSFPHHTAIVERNLGGGRFILLEQNVNGQRWVHEDTVDLLGMTQGTLWVYRPVAR